jgi:palmitoyltransferase
MAGSSTSDTIPKPHPTLLRLGLTALIVHFKSTTGYMKSDALEDLDSRVFERVKRDTARLENVRRQLGTDKATWGDLTEVLDVAVPSLSERCLVVKEVAGAEEPDTALIVGHYGTLLKDIPRLNDLVAIGRNVLTVGEEVQHLAAKSQFDSALFRLVTVCVKVSGRGFEFQGGSKEDERKWQLVVNECMSGVLVADKH